LIADRTIVSLDLGRTLEGGREIWRLLGKQSLEKRGRKKWQKLAEEIIPRLGRVVMADEVVIGGGQAELLDPLPDGVRRGNNAAVRRGGVRLWRDLPDPAQPMNCWRMV
jgi:hypothetical protein